MEKIFAPFTPEQVEKLKEWQSGIIATDSESPFFKEIDGIRIYGQPTHPFTCGGQDCNRQEQPDDNVLIPTTDGFVCPCGKYKQNWCHDFMIKSTV